MKKQHICFVVLASLALGAGASRAETDPFVTLHQYFQEPISASSDADVTRAEAYIKEGNYEKAKLLLQPVSTAYPTEPQVALLLGRSYLGLAETEEAQAYFRKAELLANQHESEVYAEARLAQVWIYLQTKEPQKALQMLNQIQASEWHNSPSRQEKYHYYMAMAYQSQQNYALTYDHLQQAMLNGNGSTPTRELVAKDKALFAHAKYTQALELYAKENYRQAFDAIRASQYLMPNNPTYINAQTKMYENFVKVLRIHSEKARLASIPMLRDIRFYLETENYAKAYQSHMKLLTQENIAFFVRNQYLYYLPKNMSERIQSVDSVLRLHGYQPPKLGT